MTVSPSFHVDPYPGRPRILFVGLAESSHTQAWIDLLAGANFNVRLFALPTGTPPSNWNTRTYLTAPNVRVADSATRLTLPAGRSPQYWLANVIRSWQPDIIHTLGFDPAGALYFETRQAYQLAGIGQWVLQLRGGSDIVLHTMNPALAPWLEQSIRMADQLIVQNQPALEFLQRLGARPEQLASLNPIHGTGGIDVEALAQGNSQPSQRRVILVPKAYNSVWSLASPVLEALHACWSQLQPCEVYLLASSLDIQMHVRLLPADMRQAIHVQERIPRAQALALMKQARVLLAPSIIDGFPAVVMEAMATGALPIISPLDTITPTVRSEDNVLFARNLYPQEIADALVCAMTDDALVERTAQANLRLIRQFGDRAQLRPRVLAYYETLAAQTITTATARVAHHMLADFTQDTSSSRHPLRRNLNLTALQIEYEHVFYRSADLERTLSDLRSRLAVLTEQADRTRETHEVMRADYERSQAEVAAAQKRVAELQQEYALVSEQALALMAEIEALKRRIPATGSTD